MVQTAQHGLALNSTDMGRLRRPRNWRVLDQVEFATLNWVDWFNNERLLEPIGYVPPAEFEGFYYRNQEDAAAVAALT